MVRIACKTADLLPLDAIEDLQGGLKKRSKYQSREYRDVLGKCKRLPHE